jgi:hypothetical protein
LADQTDKPDEEDVSEIISSLNHEIEELHGPDGSNLIKTIVEKRGLLSSTREVFANPPETFEEDVVFPGTPADAHTLLFMAANRHLRAKGEMDFFAVVETAEDIAHAEGKDPAETISRHFGLWLEELTARTGSLSIETAAARFLNASDRLFALLDETPEMQEAAFNYADAWHRLHMELMGEHELAAKGADAERGRKAGPEAKRNQGAARSAIIALAYEKFAKDEPDATRRTSTKYAAEAIIDSVNDALRGCGLDPIALGTIKNQLPAIIKAAKAKPT